MSAGVDLLRIADIASGLLWAITYVLIIRRGYLDKIPGAPLAAVAAAISWELIFAVVRPTPVLPRFAAPTWLVLDSAIVYQVLRYGPTEEPRAAPAWFYAKLAAVMAVAFVLQYAFILDWGDRDGAYSGFAVNVVMSLAFIARLDRRRDVRGQSMYIAMAKLLGSVLAIPHAYVMYGYWRSLRAFMAVTFLGDVVYAVLLHRQCRAQGIRPFARW